ncbi:MAG: C4-dicarboxylate TRAP transporter substrate-binding protein [Rhodobacterales bacterium]|nr:C4-dicarboxylate TRAP transporter substrate-binding protein [Rhodobacterales bacterium]
MNTITRNAIAAASILATALAAGAADARELVYGSWVSPKHSINSEALPRYFDAIAAASGGKLTWKLVAGGQLMNGRGTVESVGDGIADAGFVVPTYVPSSLPATATIYSSLVFGDDIVAAGGAAVETLLLDCPQCKAEFKKNNAVTLAGYTATPFVLMCSKPVTSLDDLKGKKVRVTGSGVKLMEMAGATPVAMSPAEATTALQRGTVDCVLGSASWLKSYGYQDVAKHILNFPMGMTGPVLTAYINRDTWNSLSDQEKQYHLDAAPLLVAHSVLTAYKKKDAETIKAAKEIGVTLYDGGPEFQALVDEFQVVNKATTSEQFRKIGLKDPESIIDALHKNLKKWRALSKDIGDDVDKYRAVLKREIYDKLTIKDF